MGSKQVRTIRMSFQAPPGPGLYTFQVYAMSDAFVGTDAQKDMRVSWIRLAPARRSLFPPPSASLLYLAITFNSSSARLSIAHEPH